MPKDRKRSLLGAGAAVALVLVFAATWAVLDRSEHRPGWLVAEAPPAAVIGQPLEIRITLEDPIEPTRIACTLHRAGTDRRIREHIALSGPAQETGGGRTHVFHFEVPDKEDLVFLSAVVYLSPTGSWQDRTRAAHTRLIPVRRHPLARELQELRKIRVYRSTLPAEDALAEAAAPETGRGPSSWDHAVIFVILLATAVLCRLKAGNKRQDAPAEESVERTVWLVFAAVLALGGVFELSGLVDHLANWARRLAEGTNVYELRKAYQKAIMAAVAAASLGLFFLFIRAIRRPGSHRYLWWAGIGLAEYLAVSFVSVLSFHAVDVFRGTTWHGLSPMSAARGAGTLVTLLAASLALHRKRGKTVT